MPIPGSRAAPVVVAWVLLGALSQAALAEVTIADPGTRVVDSAAVLELAARQRIEDYLAELERKTSAQVKLLTLKTTGAEDIFTFAQRHFDTWKLGQKGKDNGALIVLAVDDRQARIHTGYGLEGALPDGWCGSLLRKVRDEFFRAAQYSEGLQALTVAVANKVADEQGVALQGVPAARHEFVQMAPSGWIVCLIILSAVIITLVLILVRQARSRRIWQGEGREPAQWGAVLQQILRESTHSSWDASQGGFGGGGGSFGGGGSSGGGGASTGW
jgi:uncharacterized protein